MREARRHRGGKGCGPPPPRRHPISQFGMIYGTVESGEDVFDNIDPALLVSNISDATVSTAEPMDTTT